MNNRRGLIFFGIAFFIASLQSMELDKQNDDLKGFENQGQSRVISLGQMPDYRSHGIAISPIMGMVAVPAYNKSLKPGQEVLNEVIQIYSPTTGKQIKTLFDNTTKSVNCLSFSRDEQNVLVGYENGYASIINIEIGEPTPAQRVRDSAIIQRRYDRGPKSVFENYRGQMTMHCCREKKKEGALEEHDMHTGCCLVHTDNNFDALSPDGYLKARYGENKKFEIFTEQGIYQTAQAPGRENEIRMAPTNDFCAMWDLESRSPTILFSDFFKNKTGEYQSRSRIYDAQFRSSGTEMLIGLCNVLHRVETFEGNRIGELFVDGIPEEIAYGNSCAASVVTKKSRRGLSSANLYIWNNLQDPYPDDMESYYGVSDDHSSQQLILEGVNVDRHIFTPRHW